MDNKHVPKVFWNLQTEGIVNKTDILKTQDGFWLIYKSLSDMLLEKGISDFPAFGGKRFECSRFYDDWFIYAVPDEHEHEHEHEHIYSLLKLREQEHDAKEGSPADGDTPGVTISFISFSCEVLLDCFENPSDENRTRLDDEINRVVACRGQQHHRALKRYFISPKSEGAYLVADAYIKRMAALATDGYLTVPEHYKEIAEHNVFCNTFSKWTRLTDFIEQLNQKAGCVVCDNEKIYIKNKEKPDEFESLAILATHTGNTSICSFAAEVEYHARFLTPLAKIKIPLLRKSIYDSAIRADMSIGDTENQGFAPFYREKSRIVKRQYGLHSNKNKK